MIILLTIIHVLVCALLVLAVLLQSGKGGGLAGALGGGMSSSSVLGGRSAATFLSKSTTILATVFMLSCLVQAIIVRSAQTEPTTAIERVMQTGSAPVTPAPFDPSVPGDLLQEETAAGDAAAAPQEQPTEAPASPE